MTDGLNVPLSSRACLGFQSVHSDVYVACLFFILVLEPFLSGSSRDPFSSRDTLDRFARTAVADQDGNPIRRMKVCTNVLACCVVLHVSTFVLRHSDSSCVWYIS